MKMTAPWAIGLGLLMTMAFVPAAGAQTPAHGMAKAGGLSPADRTFVVAATEGGMAEIELSRLSVTRASSETVKSFGERMITDHTRANDELEALAKQKGFTAPHALGARQKVAVDRLEKLQGAGFDKAYITVMLKDHREAIAAFEKASKSAADADLKAWATATLPTLREHLQLAEDAAAKLGVKGTSKTE